MSVTAAGGFVAAGGSAGIKAGGAFDLALVATEDGTAVPCAGVFTSNLAPAAPVQVSRSHLGATGGRAAAVVLTSGNANAATGAAGLEAARRLCRLAGEGVGAAAEEVLVCQTGLIGVPFPIDVVEAAVGPVVAGRASTEAAGRAAATAIMTTDTTHKEVVVRGARGAFVVGGMAKGAAMLAPDMATMLAVLTTDAGGDPEDLYAVLSAGRRPHLQRHDRRRLHLDQRHRAAPGQRPGRGGGPGGAPRGRDRGLRLPGRPDGGRRRGRHQGGPRPGDRGRAATTRPTGPPARWPTRSSSSAPSTAPTPTGGGW